MKMYHATDPGNVGDILANGLKTEAEESAYTDEHAEWIDNFYRIRPVFLSAQKGKYAGIPLLVDVSGLDVVADLASIADLGDQPPYIEAGEMIWDDGMGPSELSSISSDGAVNIESMLVPGSKEATIAIAATDTAAVLQDISSDRIKIARWDESVEFNSSLLHEYIERIIQGQNT